MTPEQRETTRLAFVAKNDRRKMGRAKVGDRPSDLAHARHARTIRRGLGGAFGHLKTPEFNEIAAGTTGFRDK